MVDSTMSQPTESVSKQQVEMQPLGTGSFSEWYRPTPGDPCLAPAIEAYNRACQTFGVSAHGQRKEALLVLSSRNLEDTLAIVQRAKSSYDVALDNCPSKKWLSRFSRRVLHYGNILDVFMQHHPEYVALAWGAMKALFVICENHEKKLHALAKALSQVADVLPRAELVTTLYPTRRVKVAVAELYGHILTFCVRAKIWYEEGSFKHALHAFTQPTELVYTDLIEEITACSQRITSQATAAEQAEQRDMHLLLIKMAARQDTADGVLQTLQTQLQQCHNNILNNHIQTTTRLEDIQLAQIMDYVRRTSNFDELKCLQMYLQMKMRRGRRFRNHQSIPVWFVPKVQAWNKARQSSLLIFGTDCQSMHDAQSFCIEIIDYLRGRDLPVVWALTAPLMTESSLSELSSGEVLRSMVSQTIRLNRRMHSDRDMNLTCQRVRTAETENDWLSVLGAVMSTLPYLYIVIDLNLLDGNLAPLQTRFNWVSAFGGLFQELAKRGVNTVVKVVLVRAGIQYTERERKESSNYCVSLGSKGRSLAAVRRDIPVRVMKGRRKDKRSFVSLNIP